MIGNYKSSNEETISKRKLAKVLNKYVRHAESKVKNKKIEQKDYLYSRASSKIVRKSETTREDQKRYLFELFLPSVSINYLHHNIKKELTSDDMEHLINSGFENWKLYIIRTLFRMEFSINDPIPTKLTDRFLSENSKKGKRKSPRKLKIKQGSKVSSDKPKSDDTKSQGITTEEEEEANRKNIVIKKNEVEKVQKAQKNIKFWFD